MLKAKLKYALLKNDVKHIKYVSQKCKQYDGNTECNKLQVENMYSK